MIDPKIPASLWASLVKAVDKELDVLCRQYGHLRVSLIVCPARFPGQIHICLDGQRKRVVKIIQDTETPALYVTAEDW